MRARAFVGAGLAAFAIAGGAACGFGVDLDGLFGDAPPMTSPDASADGGEAGAPDSSIPSIRVEQLSMGTNHGCGRRIDGTVMCWGQDTDGELGDGQKVSSGTPVLVKDVSDAIDVAVGTRHACIVHRAGNVSCWGTNGGRQLGDGTTTSSPTPRDVVQLADVQRLALGDAFSCALKKDGTVHCWGDDSLSQLGDGQVAPRSQPAPVMGLANATQVVAGAGTACALVKSGDVYCWGRNNVGQAAVMAPADVKTATKVAMLTGVASLGASADSNHFCAVLTSGAVQCWGSGGSGQLGNAKTESGPIPVSVLGLDDAVGVTTGGGHSCAWRKSGVVSCWGQNNWKQLGLGESAPPNDISSLLAVAGLTGVKQVAAGAAHTCALSADGQKISCWGSNVGHGLGRGTRVLSAVPIKVAAPQGITRFALGGQHSCAIDVKGGIVCWGANDYRQLSVTTFLATGAPTLVPGVTGVTRAAAGTYHTCALLSSGQALCWGGAQYGNMGNGQANYIEQMPVTYAGSSGKTDIGAGHFMTCALYGSKDVTCAGLNDGTRLGVNGGNQSNPVTIPGAVDPDAGVDGGPPPAVPFGATSFAIGFFHSCAIRSGTLTCWGNNGSGECGVGPSGGTTPVDVPLGGTPIDVAAGGAHTCVVLSDGSVRCFGSNGHGQTTGVGDGPSPHTPNLGAKTAKAIAAGDEHTCALLNDETVVCWGKGTSGQLGNDVRADAPSPVAVKNLAGVKTIAAGGQRSCATLADGSGYCWGDNRSGELGDGAIMSAGAAGSVVGY